jgi:hypothetical protein
MAFSTLLVMAKEEQIPKTAIATWFSNQNPFFNTLKDLV